MNRAGEEDLYKLPPVSIQSFDDWRQQTQEATVEFDPEPDYSDGSDDGGSVSSAQRGRVKTTAAKSRRHRPNQLPPDDSNRTLLPAHPRLLSQHPGGKALFFQDDYDEEYEQYEDVNSGVTRAIVGDNSDVYSQAIDESRAQAENSVNQMTQGSQNLPGHKKLNQFKDEKNRSIKDKLENFSPTHAEQDRMAQQIDAEFTYLSTEDFGDEDSGTDEEGAYPSGKGVPSGDLHGIILPKKLINPCIDSKDHQDLRREMLLNKKMGVDVLNKKSDLKKELERRKERQKLREKTEQMKTRKTVFEEVLDVQAQKLKKVDSDKQKDLCTKNNEPEFLKVHSKIRSTKSNNS